VFYVYESAFKQLLSLHLFTDLPVTSFSFQETSVLSCYGNRPWNFAVIPSAFTIQTLYTDIFIVMINCIVRIVRLLAVAFHQHFV